LPIQSDGALTQADREIGVSFAPAVEDDVLLLQSFDHEERLGRPSVTTLELRSTDGAIDPNALLGQAAVVRLDRDGEPRQIHGYVWSFECQGQRGGLWVYRAELRSWLGMMEANREYRVFQEKTGPDVVQALLGSYSAAMDFEVRLLDSYRTRDLCVQYGESDSAFVHRLLEDDGVHYAIRYDGDRESVELFDDSTMHPPRPGDAAMMYQPVGGGTGAPVHPEAITRFTRRSVYRCGSYASLDYSPVTPSNYLIGLTRGSFDHGASWRNRYGVVEMYAGGQDQAENEVIGRRRMEEAEAAAEVFVGETRSRFLSCGMTFEVREHPAYSEGSFLTTSVRLSAETAPWVSGGSGSAPTDFACSFEAIPADRPFRPRRITPKPKAEMQTAVVVAAADGDDTPDLAKDDYCCVRLRFHWDHFAAGRPAVGEGDDVSDPGSSCWVRTSQSWAGKNYGWVSIPHPGQEVIVDFIDGNPDRPMVVGRVYNEENRPMMTPAENKAKMQLRDSGQNHILLGADKGTEGIELFSPTGRTRIRIGGAM